MSLRLAVIMMQRNEDVLLDAWLKYHCTLFGAENVWVLDNGTDSPACITTMQNFAALGVNIRSHPGFHAFNTKGALVASTIASEMQGYDWVFPVDCDEFVCCSDNGCPVMSRHQLEEELEEAARGGCPVLRIESGYWNVPHTSDGYVQQVMKVVLSPGFAVPLDEGFHLYSFDRKTPTIEPDLIAPTRIAIMHLHNRPYAELLSSARRKLESRVPDFLPSTMRDFRGAGWHLCRYFLMDEDQYLTGFPNTRVPLWPPFRAAGINQIPFSQCRSPADSDLLARLRAPENPSAHVQSTGLSAGDLRLIAKALQTAGSCCIAGSIGLIEFARHCGVPSIRFCDADPIKCAEVLTKVAWREDIDSGRITVRHRSLGALGDYGYPRQQPSMIQLAEYLEAALQPPCDVLVVAGRYRLAMLIWAYQKDRTCQRIILQDSDRPQYGAFGEFFDTEQRGERVVLLSHRTALKTDSRAAFEDACRQPI